MDFLEIRRLVVIAMFSDDVLFERLVLKGGNALELIHRVIHRGSLDIDIAIPDDFEDLADTERRIFAALHDRFDSAGFLVFDERFGPRPSKLGTDKPLTWGGYLAEFKFIDKSRAAEFGHKLDRLRREAHTIGPGHQRVFRIEISKYEFCSGKVEADLEGYSIFVYTPEMCVLEKLRALCQQMPDYPHTGDTKRARARDFYDVFAAVEKLEIDLGAPESLELCQNIFAAKEVPLSLLRGLPDTREFHRPDWELVRLTVPGEPRKFDYYFDYIARVVLPELKPLWEKEAPA